MENYDELQNRLKNALIQNTQKRVRNNVGVLFFTESKPTQFLLLKRVGGKHDGFWSMLSGAMDEGERPMDALKREVFEEIGLPQNSPLPEYKYVGTEPEIAEKVGGKDNQGKFHYYIGRVAEPFPIINLDRHENSHAKWFTIDTLPNPLYPNMMQKFNSLK